MMRLNKGAVLFDEPDYTLSWSVERAAWTIYDKLEKQHHYDLKTLGLAHEKLDQLAKSVPTIGLVACCKTKLAVRTTAERLYTSDLFKKASAYCQKNYSRWFVLSAKYGLVCPSQLIEPYDQTLIGQPADKQKAWAVGVLKQLKSRDLLAGRVKFCVHAGQDYARFLIPSLPTYELPLKGLGIGEQLAWYKKALAPFEKVVAAV